MHHMHTQVADTSTAAMPHAKQPGRTERQADLYKRPLSELVRVVMVFTWSR